MFLYSTVSTLKPKMRRIASVETLRDCCLHATRTDRRDGGDDFAELELVQNRRFPGSIETNLCGL